MKKKIGVPHPGGKVSRQRWRVRGRLPPEKIKSLHFEEKMVLLITGYTLEMSLPSLISQTSKLQTLLAKFSFLANLVQTENRLFFLVRPWL